MQADTTDPRRTGTNAAAGDSNSMTTRHHSTRRGPADRARRLALGLALAVCTLPACSITHVTEGEPLRADLSSFREGQTTKRDVLARLGPPLQVRRQFDGDLFIYRTREMHTERLLLIPFLPFYERTEGSAKGDAITLLFDKQGVLKGVGRHNGR